MKALTEADIRTSIINASGGEIERMPLPGLHEVIWDQREYLGWRDHQSPLRGFLVHWVDDRPIGIALRTAGVPLRAGISAMCALCHTAQPSDQVSMFSAAKAGEAGRNGNSIGTYICSDLACSLIIRVTPHGTPDDNEYLIQRRAAGLLERVARFTAQVMKTA